jgi:hypothetical protein
MVLAAASPAAAPRTTLYRPIQQFENAMRQDNVPPVVVRAQSPSCCGGATSFYGPAPEAPATFAPSAGPIDLMSAELSQTSASQPQTLESLSAQVPPNYQTFQDPFASGVPGDPWLGGAPLTNVDPFAPNAGLSPYGFNGAQPYQFGWTTRIDYGILADEGTTSPFGSVGGWGIQEFDLEKELVTPIGNNYIFGIAPQFNYRSWEGPSLGAGFPGLHGSMFRFGLGLKLVTPDHGGWNVELGFNPGYATDFDNTNTSDALQLDGHAVLFWRMTPQWMWAFGAAYWDRVDDMVVPNAGFVWTPNDIWEFRLVFPKPRISMFLGTPFGIPTWAYVRGEYHVESYAVQLEPTVGTDLQVQIEDWRALGGIRTENGAITSFAEVGWVFERDVKTDIAGIKGQLHSGLIGRVGFRF